MQTSNSISALPKASRFSMTGIIIAIGFISSALAWWLIAFPVATFGNAEKHQGHFSLLYVHMLGGTIMLFLGLSNFRFWHILSFPDQYVAFYALLWNISQPQSNSFFPLRNSRCSFNNRNNRLYIQLFQ